MLSARGTKSKVNDLRRHLTGPGTAKAVRGFFGSTFGGRRIVFLGTALLSAQACATLPDGERHMAATHDQQVLLEGTTGPLSVAESSAVLAAIDVAEADRRILNRHLAFEQAVNLGSPLVMGNRLTLLQDGPATYEAMFTAIRSAEDHIHMQTFIIDDGEIGTRFADLLIERRSAGVQVSLIYDSVGGLKTPQSFFDRLREAGVAVLEFNPINPLDGNSRTLRLNNRDHRKLLVIDGHTAFVGGINISDTYSSGPLSGRSRSEKRQADESDTPNGWRDTHVRIEGPVVAEFQKLFLDTWEKQDGAELASRNSFPALSSRGDGIVRAIASTPDDDESPIYLTLISAISRAQHEVHLTIAYFGPDPQLLDALTDAAERGVEVVMLFPSYSDSWPIFNLGRSYYSRLLRGGVRVFERQGALMHAKTASIDGVWSTVGSTNLDWRSFLHNDEVNAVILDSAFAAEMGVMFNADLAESKEILLAQWRWRSWLSRLKEQVSRLGAYWL